ncbi:hypothetical protein RF11_02856 [Thelohanellus kitauei]|uniref:Uncharacterized protein n=1 Tax=Thelohanellus kitauei TaxID=669202 RepID=A0A0C2J6U7_THEKT|nr:hypothetical protein RF11_02856 [Thelohanellus kitauei]
MKDVYERLSHIKIDHFGVEIHIKYHNYIAAVYLSYLVALRIFRAMKPHAIAQELFLPQPKILFVSISERNSLIIEMASQYPDTVHRRITDMSADILDQTIDIMKHLFSTINFQLDLSTAVAD